MGTQAVLIACGSSGFWCLPVAFLFTVQNVDIWTTEGISCAF